MPYTALILVRTILEPAEEADGEGSFVLGDRISFLSCLALTSGLEPVGMIYWPGVFERIPLLGVFGFGTFATIVTPMLYSFFLLYALLVTSHHQGHSHRRQTALGVLKGAWPFNQRSGGEGV